MLGLLIKGYKWIKFSLLGRRRGIRVGRRCQIGIRSQFEGANSILDGTTFMGKLGYGSYIGERCYIDAVVGRYCSISAEVVTIGGRHPVSEFVSTHPAFYSVLGQAGFTHVKSQLFEEHAFADAVGRHGVVIGHDVLISHGVRLLEGVKVGDGAILAAGCLVRTDVEPYAIYGGVPARKIGQRFDDETVRQLMAIRWWDRGEEWIQARAALFSDMPAFLAACSDELPEQGRTTGLDELASR